MVTDEILQFAHQFGYYSAQENLYRREGDHINADAAKRQAQRLAATIADYRAEPSVGEQIRNGEKRARQRGEERANSGNGHYFS